MKCTFISDLHIKRPGDKAEEILQKFFSNENTQSSNKIFLLGDIFDFLIGEHKGHIDKYPVFFDNIIKLLDLGKEVYFIEGNHDFHFKQTVEKHIKTHSKNPQNFHYLLKGIQMNLGDFNVFICHGYEVDYHNKYFKRWYKVYTSSFMRILTSYILPLRLLTKLAEMASKDSKRRGKKTFNYREMKEKYILGAQELINELGVDGVVGGHTHIAEFKKFDDETFYYNVGFPLKDNHCLVFDQNEFKTIEL